MKKTSLIIVLIISSFLQVHADDIIYTNGSDSNYLYLKSASDTSNGSAITSVTSNYASFSPDGTQIVYVNGSDNSYLYLKSASDTSNGSAINSVASKYPSWSPDGNYIIYSTAVATELYKKSASDTSNGSAITTDYANYGGVYSADGLYIFYSNQTQGNLIYKKSASDTSNGSAVTTSTAISGLGISPDGTQIAYRNGTSGGYLYKKSASDTSNGSAITTVTGVDPSFSPDGTQIVYSNSSDNYLYLKSASDTSSGSAITSVISFWPDFRYSSTVTGTCSDGIKNQDETGIDFGGICNCYQISVFARAFVPFNYGDSGFLQYSPFSIPFVNETLNFVLSGSTWIQQIFPYSMHVNQAANSGSLLDVMSTMSGSPSGYAVQYLGSTEIEVWLRPDDGIDWTTTDNSTMGSNAVNRVRVLSDMPWDMKYWAINDVSTASGIVNNVEDDNYSWAYPDVYGNADLTPLNVDKDRRTRHFIIRFRADNPTITSIQWGDQNKTLSTETRCPAKSSEVAQAIANAEKNNAEILKEQERILSGDTAEQDIFSCTESGLGVLICPFQIISRIWEKFLTALSTIGNFLYGVSSIGSPPGTGNIIGFFSIQQASAEGMIELPTIWTASNTGSTGDMLNDTIASMANGVEGGSGGIHSLYTFVQYAVIVIILFVVIVMVVLAFII